MRRTWLAKGNESLESGCHRSPGGPVVGIKFTSNAGISKCAVCKIVEILKTMSARVEEGGAEIIWSRTDLQISCLCLLQGPRSIAELSTAADANCISADLSPAQA